MMNADFDAFVGNETWLPHYDEYNILNENDN